MFARQIQHWERTAPRDLATMRTRRRAVRLGRRVSVAVAAVLAGTVALSLPAFAAPAAPSVTFTKLTLLHGWGTYPFGSAHPAVADISGIVSFKGAISTSSGNTNNVAFVLPPGLRPARYVNVPVDMCNATGGQLNIAPTGVTQVISEGANSNATCFSSLDGVSFALSTASFTTLRLRPGWVNSANSGRKAAARVIDGIVHLAGEIRAVGTNPVAFTLPAGLRPARNVFVAINLCTGSIGRLDIKPTGVVSVEAEGTSNFWLAQCGTSLEGASFALSSKSFTALTLKNGWMNAPYGTAKAAVRYISGIVHFKGAIWTNRANPMPFTLPMGFRPAKDVFVIVDLCGGNKGRLDIQPDGVVTVQAESSDFNQARCFTSLDGTSFAR